MNIFNLNHSKFALLSVLFCASVYAQEYKIKLVRPMKVGDECVITVAAKLDRTIVINTNGQASPPQTDGFTAYLHGVVKVLEINQKAGVPTRITCKVDKLTKDGAELYAPGTVITAEKVDKKSVFTIDGKKVDSARSEVLEAVLDVEDPNRTTSDDELTGTDRPQKVGDTWPLHAESVAKDLAEHDMTVDPHTIRGECKLVEVTKLKNTQVLVIDTTIETDDLKGKLPDGTAMTGGSVVAKLTYMLPVDGSAMPVQNKTQVKVVVKIDLPRGMGQAVVTTGRDVKMQLDAVHR